MQRKVLNNSWSNPIAQKHEGLVACCICHRTNEKWHARTSLCLGQDQKIWPRIPSPRAKSHLILRLSIFCTHLLKTQTWTSTWTALTVHVVCVCVCVCVSSRFLSLFVCHSSSCCFQGPCSLGGQSLFCLRESKVFSRGQIVTASVSTFHNPVNGTTVHDNEAVFCQKRRDWLFEMEKYIRN